MKKLLLSFMLLGFATSVFSQKKNHLTMQLGYAIPIGSYGATKGSNASYATTKNAIIMGYQHQFKWWYIGTHINLVTNGFNAAAYDKDIQTATNNTAQSTTKNIGYAIVGADIAIGLNVFTDSTWYIGAHIKPGVALYMAGSIENTTTNSSKTIQTSSSGIAQGNISYAFGTQVRYMVTPKASIMGTIDCYFGSVSGNTTIDQTVNGIKTINNQHTYVKQKFSNLLFTIGAAYSF